MFHFKVMCAFVFVTKKLKMDTSWKSNIELIEDKSNWSKWKYKVLILSKIDELNPFAILKEKECVNQCLEHSLQQGFNDFNNKRNITHHVVT